MALIHQSGVVAAKVSMPLIRAHQGIMSSWMTCGAGDDVLNTGKHKILTIYNKMKMIFHVVNNLCFT